ncbi:sigma-70 family RNA polymerase sigma factor [Streptomyces sp. NPDC052101]|uniref:sigma-70 family RNA polymerase sigma factor n=1 Tax=Streptomyces sp. NPDC052101 TaxID=3155763 RepID=UPI0034207D75
MDRAEVGALVRAAVDGDTAAWKALVEGLSPLVWSVVRAHRLPDADAHDVYQKVWFSFARHASRIREPDKAGAWLAATARHECLRALKGMPRPAPADEPRTPGRVDEDPVPDAALPDPEGAAAEGERVRQLWEEFEQLGERCRQLLRLLLASPPPSYREISVALGIPVGSIGPMRQRCLRRLRARLDARHTGRDAGPGSPADPAAPEPPAPQCNFTAGPPAPAPQDLPEPRVRDTRRPGEGARSAAPPGPYELNRLVTVVGLLEEPETLDEPDLLVAPDEFTLDYVPPAWYSTDAGDEPHPEPPAPAPAQAQVPGPVPGPVPASAPPVPQAPPGWPPASAGPPQPFFVLPPPDAAPAGPASMEPRSLVAELVEQTSPGRVVPLHVQIVQGGERGAPLRSFRLPPAGAQVIVTLHAPGLEAVDDLHQALHVMPGVDSDVLLFRLRASKPGLHEVTVRAFRGGTFLGEVICQMSVGHGQITRDGPQRHAPLASVAFDPGEVTLQVLKEDGAGAYSFQLISETFYAREVVDFRGGDPRKGSEAIYAELRKAAKAAAGGGGGRDASWLSGRLKSQGVELWKSVVPQRVQSQFWAEVDQVTAFTVLGEHDIVPWELLYPLNEGHEDRGFLAEWLPVVRRVHGQDRVRSLRLPRVAYVVPPGSPDDAGEEVTSLRARLGTTVSDAGVLTDGAALTALIEGGHAGLLHFACHNAFTGTGSCVTMADGPFDPIELASAVQLRTLRPHRPLVFFNACRSAGEIEWFGESLGWAPQFLNAGAGAFVGTLWPVRSRSALQFAETFYDQLITRRQPLGKASLLARQTTRDQHAGDPTWLAYAVYGSPAATAHIAEPRESST